MQHLLSNVTADDVIESPFPHVIIKDALDPELYQALSQTFPDADLFAEDGKPLADNKSYRYAAHKIFANERVSDLWKEFVRAHVSQEFYTKFLEIFDKHIKRLYPNLPEVLGVAPEKMTAGPRGMGETGIAGMDAQFVYTTPVSEVSTSCPPHTDRERCLYGGMLYMRQEGDDSEGGDLDFYQFKPGKARYRVRRRLSIDNLDTVKTVHYDSNLFLIFLHSAQSLHGVSPRSVTPYPRRYINFICEYPKKIYDINDGIEPRISDLPARLLRQARSLYRSN